MKKSLLAVAVAAALPFAAHAQTNVTMYGIADAGVGYVKSTVPGTSGALRVDSGIQSSSRWGVRGSEDLGGGLSAIFNAEAAWSVDDGTGGASSQPTATTNAVGNNGLNFQRRSFVGLQGAFGQVYLGRDYTPAFYAGLANDIFGFGLNGSTLAWNVAGFQSIRYSNAIFYNTPTWGGLQIRTVYGKNTAQGTEFDTASKKRDQNFEIAALYAAGPIQANAYYRHGYESGLTTNPTVNPPGFLITDPGKIKQYGVGAGYNFGLFRIVGQYALSDPSGRGIAFIQDKVKMYNIGVGVRVGAGEVMVQASEAKYQSIGAGGTPKADTAAIAYTYPLSKRTNLYATYAKTWNKNGASLGLQNSANTYGTVANGSPQAVAFGVRHQF